MNLELPFAVETSPELDEYLAAVDRALDALFLDDVQETVETLREARTAGAEPAAA